MTRVNEACVVDVFLVYVAKKHIEQQIKVKFIVSLLKLCQCNVRCVCGGSNKVPAKVQVAVHFSPQPIVSVYFINI